jgi:diguanylate cyclase (GGDEF)-like protein
MSVGPGPPAADVGAGRDSARALAASDAGSPARWARQHLAVRVSIGMWITQGLVGPAYLALPGVDARHAGAVFICSGVAFAWALMNLLIPSDPRLAVLYPIGGTLALVDVSVLVASSGGASSPLRASQLFCVVFAAWFTARRSGVRVLAGAIVVTLLPLVYDSRALAGPPLGWTIMLTLTFVVVGMTIIAARRKLENLRDRAREDSLRDPLTGLANRRALEALFRRLALQRQASNRLGVVLIDLDHFKDVNTRHGLTGGDRALTVVADALRDVVREGDLVARIGGDEFAILAPGADADVLAAIGQRAVHGVAAASETLGLDGITLGASAGAALFPADGSTPEELFVAADLALSGAKADGKGRLRLAA